MNRGLRLAHREWENGNPSGAIRHLTTLFMQLQKLNEFASVPAGLREADSLLAEIGASLLCAHEKDHSAPLSGDLIIATYLYNAGGHTLLIRDLAESLAVPPLGLWLTMNHPWGNRKLKPGALERTELAATCRTFDGSRPWECAQQLVKSIAILRPARLFLAHHPYDCTAVIAAAAAGAMGVDLSLLHHSDMRPSTGLFLPGAHILDFTPRACVFVRSILGLRSAYLPLTCPDPGREPRLFFSSEFPTTGLSANEHKIKGMRDPGYPELVAEVLTVTRGRHVHIGPLSRTMRNSILSALQRKNLDLARFRYVERAESFVNTLREHAVDLMINTYPSGGARTAVEVMAAGIPMLWHSPCAELDSVRAQMRYPLAPVWRTVEDLRAILVNADKAWFERQAESARRWYEKQHHPRNWRKFFSGTEPAEEPEIPSGIDAHSILKDIVDRALNMETGSLRTLISVSLTRSHRFGNLVRRFASSLGRFL